MSDIETTAAEPADIHSYVEPIQDERDKEHDESRPRKAADLIAGDEAIGGQLLEQIVEGALLTAGKPLTLAELGALFEDHERPAADALRAALAAIAERCAGRGFELREVASGFRFQVVQGVATWIARLWDEKPQRYSRALLETLSLIAYRQPITRGDIEDIRGVAVASNIMKTLLEREWVRIVGHKDVPGRPAMYATTRKFLDYFNLKNLDELPPLAEIRDLDSLNVELSLEGADTPLPTAEVDAADDEAVEVVVIAADADTSVQPKSESIAPGDTEVQSTVANDSEEPLPTAADDGDESPVK